MSIPQLASRIDAVKIYSGGTTVTRIAELQVQVTGGMPVPQMPEYVEIAGLPLAVDDSSVRVRMEVGAGLTSMSAGTGDVSLNPPLQGNAPIATDFRIGLGVPPRGETTHPPADESLRAARAEVRRLEDAIALNENEIGVLNQLHIPDRPAGEPGKAPPPSPISARLALANFSDEQIRARIQEKRETQEKLRTAREHLEDLQQQHLRASTAREVRPNELRKTVVVRLSYEGTPPTNLVLQLVVEYFVPGARWTPTYVCRLNSAESTATIAVRALICQRTGEDWSGVRLELSTAEPMAWCALPELASLRIGRAQPVARKSGWRRPPIGAEILFEDFDRQKQEALAAVPKRFVMTNLPSSLSVPPLPNLVVTSPESELLSIREELEREIGASAAVSLFAPLKEISLDRLEEKYPTDEDPTSQIPIEELQLSTRAYNHLKRAQINSIADLLDYTQEDLLENTNLGKKSLQEVVEALQRRLGITLPSEKSEPELALTLAMPAAQERGFLQRRRPKIMMGEESSADLLAYGIMRLGAPDDPAKRGKLFVEQRHEAYLEILQRQKVVVTFDVMQVLQQSVYDAQNCLSVQLPPGGVNVREVAGSFDYAYSADGRVDVPSDGEFHSVALTSKSTEVDVRYVVVPREDTNVFRIAQLRNPLSAPLLSGPADVYVDGDYILSTNIATVPPLGQMELGLGVEQAIKVARNTFYDEARSGETIVAFNELRHKIKVDITNHLSREARIEVRERLPIPQDGAKVDVEINQVTPAWEKYEQQERNAPIRSGYRWQIEVPAKNQKTLEVHYTIKTFVDSELIGGNRREG